MPPTPAADEHAIHLSTLMSRRREVKAWNRLTAKAVAARLEVHHGSDAWSRSDP